MVVSRKSTATRRRSATARRPVLKRRSTTKRKTSVTAQLRAKQRAAQAYFRKLFRRA